MGADAVWQPYCHSLKSCESAASKAIDLSPLILLRYPPSMFSDCSTYVILWYPASDEIRCKPHGEWIEENRVAYYKGAPVVQAVPLFVQEDSDPERIAEIALNMRRQREKVRSGKMTI